MNVNILVDLEVWINRFKYRVTWLLLGFNYKYLMKKLFVAWFKVSEMDSSSDNTPRPYLLPRQQSGGNIQLLYLFLNM